MLFRKAREDGRLDLVATFAITSQGQNKAKAWCTTKELTLERNLPVCSYQYVKLRPNNISSNSITWQRTQVENPF